MENDKNFLDKETIQVAIICLTVIVGICAIGFGIVKLNQQSNAYWSPIVLACIENGGTMGPDNRCYGARK